MVTILKIYPRMICTRYVNYIHVTKIPIKHPKELLFLHKTMLRRENIVAIIAN